MTAPWQLATGPGTHNCCRCSKVMLLARTPVWHLRFLFRDESIAGGTPLHGQACITRQQHSGLVGHASLLA